MKEGEKIKPNTYFVDESGRARYINKSDNEGYIICLLILTTTYNQFNNKPIQTSKVYGKNPRPATQEEIDWIDYCELHDDYFEKDYVLEHSEQRLLREFIKEYLTEE